MKLGIHTYSWSLSELIESGLQPFNVVAGKDGRLYEIRQSELGTIVLPALSLPRLDEIPMGFQFSLPKIPGEMLSKALTFFRDYCGNGIELEAMIIFLYNPVREEYVLDCPFQEVSKESVNYKRTYYEEHGFIEVLQLHSHNSMDAYFSKTDNNDEKSFLIYGVVGRLNQELPELKIRAGVNGYFYDLPAEYIFEDASLSRISDYPTYWHERLKTN